MGIGSVFEAVNIVFNGLWVNSLGNSSFSQDDWVMNSLSATQDFFSSHEEVIRTSEIRVVLADSCIERSGFNWISVEHVEVSVVFLSN